MALSPPLSPFSFPILYFSSFPSQRAISIYICVEKMGNYSGTENGILSHTGSKPYNVCISLLRTFPPRPF